MQEHRQENRFGWADSAKAWIETVENDANRTHLLDPLMLELCHPMGKVVLDVGCGQGRFCRLLEAAGALAIGIDPVYQMISEASRLGGHFLVADGESLPFASQSFDICVSYLALIDIPNHLAAIGEMARVTRSGGFLVAAIVHPMASAIPYWHKDEKGNKLYWRVDRYFEDRPERVSWSGIDVTNWHRPLESYMRAFLEQGLLLDTFCEPKPTEFQATERPSLSDQRRVPNFLLLRWRKP